MLKLLNLEQDTKNYGAGNRGTTTSDTENINIKIQRGGKIQGSEGNQGNTSATTEIEIERNVQGNLNGDTEENDQR